MIAGCGGSSTPENDHVLRIAMGSPGEAQIRVWDDVAKQYMAAHPETKVEINYQQDDLYETIGLQSLLDGKNPPDIYFEWTGARLEQRVKDGFAADITEQFKTGPLAGIWDDAILGAVHAGRQDPHGPLRRRRDQRALVQQAALRRQRHHAPGDVGGAPRHL